MKKLFESKALKTAICFALIFCAIILISSKTTLKADISAQSAEIPETIDGETIEYSGNCGINKDNVKWTLYANGLLDIIGEGGMCDRSPEDLPWYSYIHDIKTINIGNGVTNISPYAFYGCDALTDISIPESVTDIGSGRSHTAPESHT